MKARYASMSDFLYKFFEITEDLDKTVFRQHDRDYGLMGRIDPSRASVDGLHPAKTRKESDRLLRIRLISGGLKTWKMWVLWLGCRVTLANKWRNG